MAIYSFVTPRISVLLKTRQTQKLQRLINNANLINSLLITVLFILLVILGRYILSLFGQEYSNLNAYLAFILVIAGSYCGTYSRSAILLLAYSDQQNTLILNSIIEWSTLIIFGILLTIKYNIIGVSIAYCLAVLCKTSHAIIMAKYKLKLKPLSII